ncbi:uncharacterized protein DMENIID0001_065270 [Sergentomyia squamirostris]
MSNCGDCKSKILREDRMKLKCVGCHKFFHGACARVTSEEIKVISDRKTPWKCLDCDERRLSFSVGGAGNGGIDLGSDSPLAESRTSLAAAVADVKKELDANLRTIKESAERLSKAIGTLDKLAKNCEQNSARIGEVDVRVCETERSLLLDTIEIHGVPERVKPRDAVGGSVLAAKILQSATGVELNGDVIDDCYIVKKKNRQQESGSTTYGNNIWIVKFTGRKIRQMILCASREATKAGNGLVCVSEIQGVHDFPVKICERISSNTRTLYSMARKYAQENGWKFVWIRDGRVLVKKSEEESRVYRLSSSKDLSKLP